MNMVHPHVESAGDSVAPSLTTRLRLETRALHEQVEAQPYALAILDHSVTSTRYAAQLHAWYAVLIELERAIARDPQLRQVCHGWTPRSSWISEDLEHLDPHGHHHNMAAQQAAARMIAWLGDGDLTTRLGALYVLEGSAMGGLVLRRHLGQALGLEEAGLRYHTGHGPMSAPLWVALKQRLDALPLEPHEQQRVIDAANAAFTHIGHIHAAL
jgi:heme oxygenase (biliverdin-IX-beta and delta-forming)